MMQFKFITALFLFVVPSLAFAQSPYQFDWKKETAISVLGLGTYGGAYGISKSVPLYSPEQIALLRREDVNVFDRIATYNYSPAADRTSDYLRLSSRILPVFLLLGKGPREDIGMLAALCAETVLINNGITSLTKSSFQRPRPIVFNENVDVSEKLTGGAKRSFISGHTSNTAAMTFFAAKVFSDYHPDSEWKPYVWVAAAALPAVTGYMRVKAGRHFPTDVLAGYAVGALTGFLVPHLHKKPKTQDKRAADLDINVGAAGASMTLDF